MGSPCLLLNSSTMALKNLVGQRIMNDVIRATIKAHNKGGPGKIE